MTFLLILQGLMSIDRGPLCNLNPFALSSSNGSEKICRLASGCHPREPQGDRLGVSQSKVARQTLSGSGFRLADRVDEGIKQPDSLLREPDQRRQQSRTIHQPANNCIHSPTHSENRSALSLV